MILATLLYSVLAFSGPDVPADAPRELADVWFRFHETQLCQGLDVVFVFHQKGLEAWCRIEDEKSYDKFLQLLQPLRSSFQIDVYATKPPPEKSPEEREPPPSAWNNPELLGRLTPGVSAVPVESERMSELFMRQRVLMFVDNTLEWEKRMRRYATDLPALIGTGFRPSASTDWRARAAAVSVQHALEIEKYAGRVRDNLTEAMPAPAKSPPKKDPRRPGFSRMPLADAATELARFAQNTGRRVYGFFYPQTHTVDVLDLQDPSLLEAIRQVRSMASEFEASVRKAQRR